MPQQDFDPDTVQMQNTSLTMRMAPEALIVTSTIFPLPLPPRSPPEAIMCSLFLYLVISRILYKWTYIVWNPLGLAFFTQHHFLAAAAAAATSL